MNTFLGGIKKGRERSGRYLSVGIKSHIDSLNLEQILKMRRALASHMRFTYANKDIKRYQDLEREMEYINWRLEK